jgi:RNA polymerase sigma factor (sigma-70 family)
MTAMVRDLPATKDEACRLLTRMVGKVASRWTRNHRQDYDDMVQEGYLGVCRAYDTFDGSKGAAFSSYAYMWINHFIRQYALKSWNNKNNTASMDAISQYEVKQSDNFIDRISIEKQISKLSQEVQAIISMRNEGYTFKEIAEELNMDSLHKARNAYMEAVECIQ